MIKALQTITFILAMLVMVDISRQKFYGDSILWPVLRGVAVGTILIILDARYVRRNP